MKCLDYCAFIIEILNHYPEIRRDIKNYTFIADNCKIHKAKAIKQFMQKNFDQVFLSPYSPEMNPIEEFFGLVKSKFRTMQIISIKDVILKSVDIIYKIESITFE